MLKLVTEKKTHVTSLKGITCEACECIRTPVLSQPADACEMPNTLYMTYVTKEHGQDEPSYGGASHNPI